MPSPAPVDVKGVYMYTKAHTILDEHTDGHTTAC